MHPRRAALGAAGGAGRIGSAGAGSIAGAVVRALALGRITLRTAGLGIGAADGNGRALPDVASDLAALAKEVVVQPPEIVAQMKKLMGE